MPNHVMANGQEEIKGRDPKYMYRMISYCTQSVPDGSGHLAVVHLLFVVLGLAAAPQSGNLLALDEGEDASLRGVPADDVWPLVCHQ